MDIPRSYALYSADPGVWLTSAITLMGCGEQAGGWRLEQRQPGVLIWRTPSGRTCTTIPAHYPA